MLNGERGRPYRRSISRSRRFVEPHPLPDPLAIGAVVVLVSLGLMNLAALGSASLVRHELVTVLAGLLLFVVMARSRAAILPLLGWACYGLSIVLLVVVVAFGSADFGARRWLTLGSFTLQPSEFAKVGLVLVLADVLSRDRPWWRTFATALVLAALPVGLVVIEPDLSTATVLSAATFAMLIIGKVPLRAIALLLAATATSAPLALHLLHPYQLARLHSFLSGTHDGNGAGWTILQSHIALGWGGLTGQSHQPMHELLAQYLPARETDLAYSSLVEQWGLLAGLTVVLASAVLVWRAASAARHARTRAAGTAAAGFAALIGVEVTVSVAANVGLLPTAGVPLPLVSYGGSAAAAHIAALGVVLGMRVDAARRPLWLASRPRRIHPRLIRVAALAITAALLATVNYVMDLQQRRGESLRQLGLAQMTRCVRLPAPRGTITDRHGTPVALNQTRYEVWVIPGLLTSDGRARLAALSGRPAIMIDQLIRQHADAISVTLGAVPHTTASRIAAAQLGGVRIVETARRLYPYGSLLGPVLGWTGVATPVEMQRWPDVALGEVVGRAGLEEQYDPILRGTDGQLCVYVDPFGVPQAMAPMTPPVPGASVRLSIDLGLQKFLTAGLATAMTTTAEHSGGNLGAAVVLDARNGQVLAMASLPSYDNRVYGPPIDGAGLAHVAQSSGNPMLEHVSQVAAPPGSTFKLVVASADMVTGTLPPDLVVETGGAWDYGGHVFHNWSSLPPQNLVQAIAWSNDVYFYKLAAALGPDAMVRVAHEYGVGRPTGLDLPGESAGYLGTPSTVDEIGATWYPGSTVLMGIGQGYIAVTPLQDAVWTAAAGTGAVVTPHLGLAYADIGGTFTALSWPSARRLSFASRLGPVRDGMRQVATNGTALLLQNLPVPAGGKTGTAEDPSAGGEGLDSWMSAVAPLDPSSGRLPIVEATAFIRGQGEGHPSSEVVRAVLEYFFAHQKRILATPPAARP